MIVRAAYVEGDEKIRVGINGELVRVRFIA
jgi:hypothetical protein